MRKELLNTRAYAIFLEELPKQLGFVHEKLKHHPGINESACCEMKAIFHTIKGGSGFFGLEDIYQSASKLEKILSGSVDSMTAEISRIKKILSKLEKSIGKLPEPVEKFEDTENA